MKIFDFLKNLINVLLDGSFERVTVINQMNTPVRDKNSS